MIASVIASGMRILSPVRHRDAHDEAARPRSATGSGAGPPPGLLGAAFAGFLREGALAATARCGRIGGGGGGGLAEPRRDPPHEHLELLPGLDPRRHLDGEQAGEVLPGALPGSGRS